VAAHTHTHTDTQRDTPAASDAFFCSSPLVVQWPLFCPGHKKQFMTQGVCVCVRARARVSVCVCTCRLTLCLSLARARALSLALARSLSLSLSHTNTPYEGGVAEPEQQQQQQKRPFIFTMSVPIRIPAKCGEVRRHEPLPRPSKPACQTLGVNASNTMARYCAHSLLSFLHAYAEPTVMTLRAAIVDACVSATSTPTL
jgi:hypothetical protein